MREPMLMFSSSKDNQPLQLVAVSLEVTGRCNQRCLYCYNRERGVIDTCAPDVATEKILEIVDLIVQQQPVKQITLTGGEPLLRRDILAIIDYIAAKGLRIGMVSNASAVDAALAAELARRQVSYVQTTFLAPDAATHDAIAGTGSFVARLAGVRHLVAAGVRVGGAFVCTKLNYRSTGDTLDMMHGWGMREHMCFMRFCPSGYSVRNQAQLAPERVELLEALAQANRFGAERGMEVHNKIPIPPCVIDDRDYPRIVFTSCGAAVDGGECFVDQRGGVRLCGPNPNELGNIRKTALGALLLSEAVRMWKETCAPACGPCHLRITCRGGCPVAEGDPLREGVWATRFAPYERQQPVSAPSGE